MNKAALQSKNIYERLLHNASNGFERALRVLSNAGIGQNEINLKKLESWWTRLHKSDLDNKVKDFQWQLSHKALYTLTLLNDIDPDISRLCVLCNITNETIDYILIHCNLTETFWRWIFRELEFNTDLNSNFVYVNNFETVSDFQFYMLCLGKITIWETRNIIRRAQLPNIVYCMKVNFKSRVQSHLTTLYYSYKDKGRLDTFVDCYLLQGKIAVIDDKISVNINM